MAKASVELFLSILRHPCSLLFFSIRPTLLTMSDLIKEIQDKENLDKQLSQKIASLSTVQPLYLRLQDQISLSRPSDS